MAKLHLSILFVFLLASAVFVSANSAPSVTLSSPPDGSSTTDTTPAFEFNATDDANLTLSCELFIDETSYGSKTVANGTTETITASPALAKKQSYSWYVNCTDTDSPPLTGQSDTWDIYINNTPPTASGVAILPDPAYTNDALNCTYTYDDAESDTESGTTFRWFNDTGEMSGETGQTLDSSKTEIGWNYTCEVTPDDGYDPGTAVNSSSITIAAFESLSISFVSPTPSNNAYVKGDETIKVTATGDVVKIGIFINGSSVENCSSTLSCTFAWDTTDYDDGEYNVSATANDSTGNSTSIERDMTVDNTNPAIHTVSLSDSSVDEGDSVTIKANVTDNIGVGWVKVEVDDTTYSMSYSSSSGLYEKTITAPSTKGSYEVDITTEDKAGNSAHDDSLTLAVTEPDGDLSGMTVTITGNCSEIIVTSSVGYGVYVTLQHYSDTAGWITVQTLQTDAYGTVKFTITSSGNYRAVCMKSGYETTTSSVFSAPPCTPPPECTVDADCTGGKVCINNTCVTPAPECITSDDCPANETCTGGSCVAVSCPCGEIVNHTCVEYECCEDDDCNETEECINHTCVAITANITNESDAESAIYNANDTISAAKLEGKNTTKAEDFLAQAEEAFESGDYAGALLLASKAEQAALSASMLEEPEETGWSFDIPTIDLASLLSLIPTIDIPHIDTNLLLCAGGGAIVVVVMAIAVVLVLIVIFIILRRRGKKKESQPGREEITRW